LVYAGNRARAALIHELLHLKYAEDEKTVRELSEDYFLTCTQKQPNKSSRAFFIYTMIFHAKISGEKTPPSGSNESSKRLKLNEACLRASGVLSKPC